jgi:predicted nucleic acid-binding protein
MPANCPAFIDTNVVLYAIGEASPKQDAAWRIIFYRPCASVQVLNECSSVLLKNSGFPWIKHAPVWKI